MAVTLAHLSDPHLDGGPRTAERLSRVVDHLRALRLDAVLVTGDIAHTGSPHEYELAAGLLGPLDAIPCPGNHDVRANYRRHLLGRPTNTDGPVNQVHDLPGLTVLSCDSTVPDHDHGELTADTLSWIAETLAERPSTTPAVLALHHPPAPLYHPLPDSSGLRRPQALASVLDAHPHLVAVLTGHAHTAALTTFAGRPVITAPSTASTLRLPWYGESEGPLDREMPPGVAFHVVDGHRITTHFRAVV